MSAPPAVLVTGASSGFGHALAGAFLAAGWEVVATLRDAPARAGRLADLARAHPGRLAVLSLDVADPAERAAVAAEVDGRPGGLDCLVNNAGYGLFGALEDLSEAQLRRQLEVNFLGPALLTRALLPALRRARGRVVNVSSVLGFRGLPLTSAYAASKFALEGWSESLHLELRPHGVQVALVEPGGHRTGFATGVEWGAGSGPGSLYAAQTAAYRALVARFRLRRGAGPERVARTVVRLAATRRMPLRTRVGADSRLAHLLGRVLPEPLAWRAWAGVAARAFTAPTGPGPAAAPRDAAPD